VSVFYRHTVPRITDELASPDETVMVILKGHLLVEEHLNRILCLQLSRPAEIEKAGLKFSQRLHLVKALATADRPFWDLIGSLNSLRNQLAHSLARETRANRIQVFLKQYFALDKSPEAAEIIQNAPEHVALARGIGFCLGLLAGYEEDIAGESGQEKECHDDQGA
jgi:hypothetical protein